MCACACMCAMLLYVGYKLKCGNITKYVAVSFKFYVSPVFRLGYLTISHGGVCGVGWLGVVGWGEVYCDMV